MNTTWINESYINGTQDLFRALDWKWTILVLAVCALALALVIWFFMNIHKFESEEIF